MFPMNGEEDLLKEAFFQKIKEMWEMDKEFIQLSMAANQVQIDIFSEKNPVPLKPKRSMLKE